MTLIDRLKDRLGAANVLTGGDRSPWLAEWTGNYPSDPLCVVRPAQTEEVAAVLRLAAEAEISVVPVGGNTGLTGGAQSRGAISLSLDRMNKIDAVNSEARTITVGAGAVIEQIETAASAEGLTFPLFFGARGSARIGGALSTNAGGSNVLRYGMVRDLCLGLEVVLADGRVLNLMSALHKDNSGLALRHLFIGAEGTLGVITRAVLRLHPAPKAHATAMVALASLSDALALLHGLQEVTSGAVEAFEYMPENYISAHLAMYPDARAPFELRHEVNVLIEIGPTAPRDAEPMPDGSLPIVNLLEETLADRMERGGVLDAVVARSEAQRREMWARRDAAAEIAFARSPKVDNDIALPLDRIDTFLTRAADVIARIDPGCDAHWVAHLGDGNIHYSVFLTDAARGEAMLTAIEDLVNDLGGSFSAEHGIGQSKLGSMRRQKDAVAIDVMRRIKTALDPLGLLNPGKVIPDD